MSFFLRISFGKLPVIGNSDLFDHYVSVSYLFPYCCEAFIVSAGENP